MTDKHLEIDTLHSPAGISLSDKDLAEFLRSMLKDGISCKLCVKGTSMLPFIGKNDLVAIAPLRKKLKVGDIIIFSQPETDRLIVHRIIKEVKDSNDFMWLVKGDNRRNPDGLIQKKCIIGIVSGVERGGRKYSVGIRKWGAVVALASRFGSVLMPAHRIKSLARWLPDLLRKQVAGANR